MDYSAPDLGHSPDDIRKLWKGGKMKRGIDTLPRGRRPVYAKSGIRINPANKGKFNALKARTGKTTEQLKHSPNPLTRKRATFAANAAKWKH